MPLLSRTIKSLVDSSTSVSSSTTADSATKLKVLQFNTLADSLSDAFPLVSNSFLNWEHRQGLLLQEILAKDPDVVALQEVDHFEDFFEPELSKHGYSGLFKPKRDNKKSDGCATFYKTERLLLHIRQDLVYKNEIGSEAGQVAILSIFKVLPKNPKNNNYNNNNNDNNTNSSNGNENDANLPLFAFLNTHLKAKPEFEDLRVKEISVVGNLLVKLRQQYPKISIVIASDMNTEPNGPVYEYLSKGKFTSSTINVSHSLPLKSAYSFYKDGNGEPDYTTWKIRPPIESCRVIDYIWYTTDTLSPTALLEIPPPSSFPESRLPSEDYPSDHLSILAEFELLSETK